MYDISLKMWSHDSKEQCLGTQKQITLIEALQSQPDRANKSIGL